MEALVGEIALRGGPVGLIVLFAVMVWRGYLVPSRTVASREASYERQIVSLTAAVAAADKRADTLLSQQQELMKVTYLVKDAAQHLGASDAP